MVVPPGFPLMYACRSHSPIPLPDQPLRCVCPARPCEPRNHSRSSFPGTPMGKKIYVGNLSYGISSSDLQQMFEAYGTVESAQVIMDRDTGRSKGFGFVEMDGESEAQAAIS